MGEFDLEFRNWPQSIKPGPLSEHSLEVVKGLIEGLQNPTGKTCRAMIVAADNIQVLERIPRGKGNPLVIKLNHLGTKASEVHVAAALQKPQVQEYLRQLVDIARGNETYHATSAIDGVEVFVSFQVMGVKI
ncbi:hypothetical protein [Rhizobium leguminosarum]|uniref:hypothetical protein n=1 Tax=Rhizobium leguminosarum TaxID=384 RepID=UPI003D07A129